nr:bromodomain and WD repeat-containing protein 3 [Quercus suber]POE57423.1 isoform c of bromodomain and wd repeat-containing protein 1 [Quercus suber]
MALTKGNMAFRKYVPSGDAQKDLKPLRFSIKGHEKTQLVDPNTSHTMERDVDVDHREIYFLIMHFLSAGPCHRTYGQLWNELLEHQLLPRRYHAWYSRNGTHSGDENDDGMSFPLNYAMLVERYPHIEKDHLLKLLKQLLLSAPSPSRGICGKNAPNAADVPTLLGRNSFSLLSYDRDKGNNEVKRPPAYMRWPHMRADQVRGLSLREIGGGFARHCRAPSIRAASYAIAKPSTMVQKMQNTKRLRGHRNAVYCAMFDRSGRYVVTGSDDRLVKIWSMETAYCLASCRGHEGDITDLAVSSNNALVASSSNDCSIRVWRLPDGFPISVLKGHTGAVTAIAFSPKPNSIYNLLSSSDDGTCRIWDARNSQFSPRIYVPRPSDSLAGKNNGPSSSSVPQSHQIFCCAFNANGTVFVTGSSDTLARVWNACKPNAEDLDQPNHEIDVLSGHENDVNYVQFSGCAVASKFTMSDTSKEENIPKFRNSWFTHDNIVTCSRDGSAIIWIPRSRRSHGKSGRWTRAYHLKVPPPPMPPQPPRGGPRQRMLPTPRGVNMIVWSLDNRFVLAAIMDCRICVWNAADGSLVHSLTGHTESTYVLDVHPFNPRIAMSAGYDGKTIVWDIWEGTPIRIYDTSRFKLVDGKFSPDGTSIILSDDVGQLYILNTGQGESQMDAKYDQFFLGDYRPLIYDTLGNALDQETQLPPYRRNMEDLLCGSDMVPYPEPYQTAYQKRRLGALGKEWHPSSLRLAVGPDFSVDPDYQMLPLADLDLSIEPLPEIVDAMDWEPENEVQSEDNDSEYNVTEDFFPGGEQGSLSSISSGDPECSAEDSEDEDSVDGLRRSKRKKQKAEVEIMTSSGRRVKRRNLDECDGNPHRFNRTRKSRNGRKASKRKSTSKSLRPQRAAARNALNLFSKITGTSTDGEDEDGSEDNLSESESSLQDSIIESDKSDSSLQNEQSKYLKGKEVSLDDCEDLVEPCELPESHFNDGNRKRLIFKLPIRDSNKLVLPRSISHKSNYQADLVGSSSKASQEAYEENGNHTSSQDQGHFSGDASCSTIERKGRGRLDKVEDHLDLSEFYSNGQIRWGGVKARTSKRLRFGEVMPSDAYDRSHVCQVGQGEKENNVDGNMKTQQDSVMISPPTIEIQNFGDNIDRMAVMNGKDIGDSTSEEFKGESPKSVHVVAQDTTISSLPYKNGTDHHPEQIERGTPSSTKLRISSKRILEDPESPTKQEMRFLVENQNNGWHESPSNKEQDPVAPDGEGTSGVNADHEDESDSQIDKISLSLAHDSQELHLNSNKRYAAVYKRSKSHRSRANLEVDSGGMGESTSNASNNSIIAGLDSQEGFINGARRTRSTRLKESTHDSDNVSDGLKSGPGDESGNTFRSTHNNSTHSCQPPTENWGSTARITVGLRSTRNRRASNHVHDRIPVDRRKSHQSAKKRSWLMLSTHEEGSRYIPQQGDEVVYLRQGHQEYIDYFNSREPGPWTYMKGIIRAVEFCKVEDLKYSSLAGSGESCCKMILKFVDLDSNVYQQSFKLTLPEVMGFPDFLVERTRFDAAMAKKWTFRDKCKVWWRNEVEGEEDGSWWDGRITSSQAKSVDFPDSPWERYTIQYKTDPREKHNHSPWELFDTDTQWEEPHIDNEIRNKLLSAFAKLEQSGNKAQDRYGVQKLKIVSDKSHFTNRFPVALSLEVIQARLENNYYRSMEALKHDAKVMLSNAESYFAKNVEMLDKIKRLSEWFTRTLASL